MEEESLFNYTIGDTSYSAINDDYLTHQPVFFCDLNVSNEVREICQENPSCVYDFVATGSMEIGQFTLDIATANNEVIKTLG